MSIGYICLVALQHVVLYCVYDVFYLVLPFELPRLSDGIPIRVNVKLSKAIFLEKVIVLLFVPGGLID